MRNGFWLVAVVWSLVAFEGSDGVGPGTSTPCSVGVDLGEDDADCSCGAEVFVLVDCIGRSYCTEDGELVTCETSDSDSPATECPIGVDLGEADEGCTCGDETFELLDCAGSSYCTEEQELVMCEDTNS